MFIDFEPSPNFTLTFDDVVQDSGYRIGTIYEGSDDGFYVVCKDAKTGNRVLMELTEEPTIHTTTFYRCELYFQDGSEVKFRISDYNKLIIGRELA